MSWLLIALLLVFLVVIAAIFKNLQSRVAHDIYGKNPVLFSAAERSFLGVLTLAMNDEYAIFGKVRVADVLNVKRNSNKSQWQRAFNKISSKHFDFVLCTKADFAIVAVIELDDKSHGQKKRVERDQFLNAACTAAELPFCRFEAKQAYSPQAIRQKIINAIQPNSAPTDPNNSLVQIAVSSVPDPQNSVQEVKLTAETATPVCPSCALPMIKRTRKSADSINHYFWGCSGFPKCRVMKKFG